MLSHLKLKFRTAIGLLLVFIVIGIAFTNCDGGFSAKNATSIMQSTMSQTESEIAIGKAAYSQYCMSCHGVFESSNIHGRSALQIKTALAAVAQMKNVGIKPEEISNIAKSWGADPRLSIPSPDETIYSCDSPNTRGLGESGIRRLSSHELLNTLRDLLGLNPEQELNSVSRMPLDHIHDQVSDFISEHNFQQVDSLVNISIEVAKYLVKSQTGLERFGSICIWDELNRSAISPNCLSQFINKLGRRVLKRNLTGEEVQKYLAVFSLNRPEFAQFSQSERLQLVIARIFQAPDFLFHFSQASGVVNNGRIRVDGFTVASRLSFRLTGSSPDEALLDAAAAGQLNALEGVRVQAQRLMNLPAARRHLRNATKYWLKLDDVAAPAESTMSRQGLSTDAQFREQWKNEVVNETIDYVEYFVFNSSGSFTELMTSELAFPRSAHLAKFMNSAQTTADIPVAKSQDGRRGLLARPAMLMSNLERERPIHRGLLVRTRILCDVIPPPPPNADQAAMDNLSAIDPLAQSTRELTTHVTKSPSCISCHSQINPIGFTMNGFGPLGELRTSERVFKSNGELANEFPIDSSASNLQISSENDSVANYSELMALVTESSKARACLPKMFFEYSRVRSVVKTDSCALSEGESAVRDGLSLKEVIIRSVANEDIFWLGQ